MPYFGSSDGDHNPAWLRRVKDYKGLRVGLIRLGFDGGRVNSHFVPEDGYRDYLASPYWDAARKRFLESGEPWECFVCGAVPDDLHHRTYERLGAEEPTDLVPLCRSHHMEVHDLHYEGEVSLFNATALTRLRYQRELDRQDRDQRPPAHPDTPSSS